MKNINNRSTDSQCKIYKLLLLLGKRAFRALLDQRNLQGDHTEEAIRRYKRTGHTLKETRAAAIALLGEVSHVREGRAAICRPDPCPRRLPSPEPWVAIPYQLPIGSPMERLTARRAAREKKALEAIACRFTEALQICRLGKREVRRVSKGAPWDEVTARAWIFKEYTRYTYHYGTRYAGLCVAIPHDYEATVVAEGLADVDGVLTLAAAKISESPGETLWKARWARKGRGYSYIVEDGYILRRNEEFAHGLSIRSVRSTLSRRATEAELSEREQRIYELLERNCPGLFSTVTVSIADSIKAGNCREGTLAFRDRYFPGRDSATVEEVLDAADTFSGRKLAIAACLRAIRSSRMAGAQEVSS